MIYGISTVSATGHAVTGRFPDVAKVAASLALSGFSGSQTLTSSSSAKFRILILSAMVMNESDDQIP